MDKWNKLEKANEVLFMILGIICLFVLLLIGSVMAKTLLGL